MRVDLYRLTSLYPVSALLKVFKFTLVFILLVPFIYIFITLFSFFSIVNGYLSERGVMFHCNLFNSTPDIIKNAYFKLFRVSNEPGFCGGYTGNPYLMRGKNANGKYYFVIKGRVKNFKGVRQEGDEIELNGTKLFINLRGEDGYFDLETVGGRKLGFRLPIDTVVPVVGTLSERSVNLEGGSLAEVRFFSEKTPHFPDFFDSKLVPDIIFVVDK